MRIEERMVRRFAAVVAIITMLLALLAGRSGAADLMTDAKIAEERYPAVLQLQDSRGTHKGYGVVISVEGHVLTVHHLVSAAPLYGRAIASDAGASNGDDNRKLKYLGRVDGQDIALLQFESKKAPSDKVMTLDLSLPRLPAREALRHIALDNDGKASISEATRTYSLPTKSLAIDFVGLGDPGYSGSPIVDRYGSLHALYSRGTSSALFSGQLLVSAAKLLDDHKVQFAEKARPAPKVRFVVRLGGDLETRDAFDHVVAPIKANLMLAAEYLSPTAELLEHEGWKNAVGPLFDPWVPRDERVKRVQDYLKQETMVSWLEQEDVAELYLFAVGVWAKELQVVLLRIDYQNGKVFVEAPQSLIGPRKKLGSPPKDGYPVHVAIEQMRNLLKQRPFLVRNNRVLADCFMWLVPIEDKPDKKIDRAKEFGESLDAIWRKKGFAAEELDLKRCHAIYGKDDYLIPKHLAEILIKVGFMTEDVSWYAHPTWDEKDRVPRTAAAPKPRGVIHRLNDSDFGRMTQDLLTEVESSSPDIFKLVRP